MAVIKTNIDEAIARVADWAGKEISYSQITGGITNPNYQVVVDGTSYFLKIPGAGTDFIDRDNCHIANQIASDTGAGPEVYYYFEDTGVEIFQWLDGYRQVTFGDIYVQPLFEKMVTNIKNFNNTKGMEMPLVQSAFEQTWDMIDRAKQGTYLPPWHDRMEYLLHQIEDATNNYGFELKPCHNDFWTNNMMVNDATGDLKIIDYEYASMNDAYYDLGVFSAINYLTEAMDVYLSDLYHDADDNKEIGFAKLKLYKIIADLKWGYWALQQAIYSDVDFDYYNWYGIKIARLQHLWLDPRLDIWLNMLNKKPVFKG